MSAPRHKPATAAMKWQANGELAGGDLQALLGRLNQVESEERARELEWLGRHEEQQSA
ncbi:hypothetical protein [Vulcanococcus sp.]|uniref:hypothetical protein n=1 Tax=Vulcanococcus sp. TaxID=2856995 RepID=UPI003C0D8C09